MDEFDSEPATCKEVPGGGGGGPKKFLYAGPKQKNIGFKEAETTHYNSSNPSLTASPGSNVSVNDMWKNISVHQNPSKPSYQEGWNRNVDKGFYSRHGGLKSGNVTESSNRGWTGSHYQGTNTYSGGRQQSVDPLSDTNDTASSAMSLAPSSRYSLNNNNKRKF